MMHRFNPLPDILAVVSGVSAITAWQEQLGWAMQLIAAAVATTAGVIAIWQSLKKRKKLPLN